MVVKLIVAGMVLQVLTYISLALGSIYESELLSGGSLVLLAVSLLMGKLALDELTGETEETTSMPGDEASDSYLIELGKELRAERSNQDK